jgi:hypothetical protein
VASSTVARSLVVSFVLEHSGGLPLMWTRHQTQFGARAKGEAYRPQSLLRAKYTVRRFYRLGDVCCRAVDSSQRLRTCGRQRSSLGPRLDFAGRSAGGLLLLLMASGLGFVSNAFRRLLCLPQIVWTPDRMVLGNPKKI